MGKYLRTAKITGDVAVMDVSQSTLGVRTRARTLALQRLQSSSSDSCYLQLRSRRLEKPRMFSSNENPKNLRKEVVQQRPEADSCKEPNFVALSRFRVTSLGAGSVGSVSICQSNTESRGHETEEGVNHFGAEVSLGENSLDFETRERSTRESTPCSLVREADAMMTTRQTNLSATAQRTSNSILVDIPSAHEMEEFFSFAEQQQKRLFVEKYNFDVVNDIPLPGQYEWIRVDN